MPNKQPCLSEVMNHLQACNKGGVARLATRVHMEAVQACQDGQGALQVLIRVVLPDNKSKMGEPGEGRDA
jgi:hypothetical protein